MITKKLLVSFLITVFSLHSITVQAITIKAPTTQNKNTENILDYDAYNNEIKQIIIEQEKTNPQSFDEELKNPSQSPFIKGEDSEIDIVPGVVSKSILQYQQEILNAIKTNASTQSTLIKASSTLIDTIRAAYATQPFTTNSVMALFNTTNYLRLRQEAEDKKKSDLKNAEDKKDTEIQKTSRRLVTLRVKIKQQFENRRKEVTQGLTNLKNSLQQKVVLAKKTIQNNKDRISQLKQLLKDKLDTFKYLSQKTSTHKKDYKRYEDKYKSAKKKYKKYKKKYKKKKKSKYKKRYKKYKKKYKTYKRRYNTHKDRYNKYKKQRNQADADYLKLQVELRKLEIKTGSLDKELIKNESNLIVATSNLIKDQNKPALEDDLEYQKATAKEGINYEASVKVINEKYTKEVSVSTELYNRGIQRAEAYQEAIDNLQVITAYRVEETRAVGQARLKYELEVQRQVEEAIQKEKELALERIKARHQATKEMASVVFAGMLKVPQQLVNTIKSKLEEAKKGLDRIKHKAKDLKEAYQENKGYEKKMKEYKKKYEKYSKKVRKYSGKKDKRSRKKYKKYNNKKSSAKKKYLKYKKKFEKYGQLKKAYKSGYKQADEIKDSYQDQYDYLLSVERQIQVNYQSNYSQASRLRKELFSRAGQERSFSLNQMEVGSPFDYDLIGSRDNSDVKNYQEVLIGNISEDAINKGMSDYLNSLATDFSSGVDALADIKGNLKDFRSKAKKAYAKRLKEIAKLQAEQERQRRAYLAAQRRQAYLAEQKKIEVRGARSGYSLSQMAGIFYEKTFGGNNYAMAAGTDTGVNASSVHYSIGAVAGSSVLKALNRKTLFNSPSLAKPKWASKLVASVEAVLKEVKTMKITIDNFGNKVKKFVSGIGNSAKGWYNKGVTWLRQNIESAKKIFIVSKKKREERQLRDIWSQEESGRKLRVKAEMSFDDYTPIPDDAKLGAMLSRKVYEKNDQFVELPEGVREATDEELVELGLTMKDLDIAESGFRMRVYYNENTKQYIFSFAGTDPNDPLDIETDVNQARGLDTSQYRKAAELGERFKNRTDIIATGQSLGGGLAALFGAVSNCETQTFNAAGVHSETLKRAGIKDIINYDFSNITNHTAYGDILTYIQEDATTEDLQKIKQIITDIDNIPVLGNIAMAVGQDKVDNKLSTESLRFIQDRINNPSDINQELPDALGTRVSYGSNQRITELDQRLKTISNYNKLNDRILSTGVKLYDMVEQHGNY